MSDHLPECFAANPATPDASCICPWLRACEARVREESFTEGAIAGVTEMAAVRPARTLAEYREANKYANGVSDERKRSVLLIADAYGKGLDAARDAVESLSTWAYNYGGNPTFTEHTRGGPWIVKANVLAAIDALKGTP